MVNKMYYEELEQKIVRLYNKKPNIIKIADKLNLNFNVVSFFLRNAGVNLQKRNSGFNKINLPMEEIKRLYVEEKVSSVKIAILYDVSSCTIINRLKEIGVDTSKKSKKIKDLTKETLEKLYFEEKKEYKEIAAMYDVSTSCILYHLKKFDIKINRRGKK